MSEDWNWLEAIEKSHGGDFVIWYFPIVDEIAISNLISTSWQFGPNSKITREMIQNGELVFIEINEAYEASK